MKHCKHMNGMEGSGESGGLEAIVYNCKSTASAGIIQSGTRLVLGSRLKESCITLPAGSPWSGCRTSPSTWRISSMSASTGSTFLSSHNLDDEYHHHHHHLHLEKIFSLCIQRTPLSTGASPPASPLVAGNRGSGAWPELKMRVES